jgi:soluble lytic murein transglycosylase
MSRSLLSRSGTARRRWLVAVLAALVPAGASLAAAPATAPPPGPTQPAVAALDLSALTPYFTEGPLQQASAKLRSGEAKAAVQLISDYVASLQKEDGKPPVLTPRVEFLLAVAQLRAAAALPGGSERVALARRAAQHFDTLAAGYPILDSYHAYYGARSRLLAQEPAEALARLARVPSDSVLDCDARFVRAEALRDLSSAAATAATTLAKPTEAPRERAVAAYRNYLAACKTSSQTQRWQAQEHAAELLDALGRPAEALQLWRRLYIEAPTENFGSLAQRRMEKSGTKVAAFTAAELIERAQVLFDAMRNPESEAAFRWALESPDLDDAQRCVARYHLAQSVFKQRQRPRAAPLFDQAIDSCAPAAGKNDDLHMKSIYQAARCHASAGELQAAADLFARAEAAHPGHSYADDARLRQAEMYQDLADKLKRDGARKTCQADSCPDYEAQFTALLADLPDRYPDGDKRAEALWRLAFRSYRNHDLDKARGFLQQALARLPREIGWDQEGRTLYWLGRLAQLGGDQAQALSYYRRTAQEYPLSFYTLMALNRVREGSAGEYGKLIAELDSSPEGRPDKDHGKEHDKDHDADEPFAFKPRALFALPGFWRGVELLRLGLGSEAQREWSAVGITVPESKSYQLPAETPGSAAAPGATAGGDSGPGPVAGSVAGAGPASDPRREQTERLWLAAVLYDRAGAWYLSHFIPRHILTGWQRHYPVGSWRKQWLLAYPRGYAELLANAARENGQPEALQVAIVREESAFDPLTESFANAIGLTQMIPPTAKRFSGGLPYDREALRDPAINVAIGARFLGFLWKAMEGNAALAIAGYNAGEGAVWRWLRASGSELRDVDAFIEAIPYDETRGYTKRVLSSYLTYAWLAPPSAGPAADKAATLASRVPAIQFALPAPPGAAAAAARTADAMPTKPPERPPEKPPEKSTDAAAAAPEKTPSSGPEKGAQPEPDKQQSKQPGKQPSKPSQKAASKPRSDAKTGKKSNK